MNTSVEMKLKADTGSSGDYDNADAENDFCDMTGYGISKCNHQASVGNGLIVTDYINSIPVIELKVGYPLRMMHNFNIVADEGLYIDEIRFSNRDRSFDGLIDYVKFIKIL